MQDGLNIRSTQYYKGGNIASLIEFKDGYAIKGTKYTFEGKQTQMTNAHFHNYGYKYK